MLLTRRLKIFADYGLPELPEKVVKAFSALGDGQRGKPESAMLVVQKIMGGGVLNPVVEHVGDITHRMSHMVKYVHVEGREKILKTLKWLTHPYGFEREMQGNIISNAKYNGMTPKELQSKLTEALTAYADAHAKLKVYNRAQWLARQAAIDIGRQKFDGARLCLSQLKDMAPDDETFAKHAMEYKLAADGEPMEYPYKSVEARLAVFAADWWDNLSKAEQQKYLKSHPRSKVIVKSLHPKSKVYDIHLRETGEHIGHVSLSPQGHPFIDGVRLEKYKGTGLGRHIYDAIQHKLGRPLVPNPLGLSEDSTRVWQKRLAKMPAEHAKQLLDDSMKAGLSYGIKAEHIIPRLQPLHPDWQPPK